MTIKEYSSKTNLQPDIQVAKKDSIEIVSLKCSYFQSKYENILDNDAASGILLMLLAVMTFVCLMVLISMVVMTILESVHDVIIDVRNKKWWRKTILEQDIVSTDV